MFSTSWENLLFILCLPQQLCYPARQFLPRTKGPRGVLSRNEPLCRRHGRKEPNPHAVVSVCLERQVPLAIREV